jgi:hypothetical protein
MALGICAICGYSADIENHHSAGKANFSELTVPTCISCHRELHKRLTACGVELHAGAPRTPADRLRALVVGFSELHRLHLERHPNPMFPAQVAGLLGRVLSREMDRLEPADRPGRWLPDPTVRVEEVMPAESHEGGDTDMLMLLFQFGVDFIDSVEHSPAHDAPDVAAFRILAADPIAFMTRAELELAGTDDGAALLADMTAGIERIHRLLLFMAAHDPDVDWPAEMLAEARLWGDTMRRLLQQLVDLAGLTAEVGR